jgi:NAD(P)-dependent dehydrogenase (short-subunit alcohol dehydrogenase family)
MSTTAIVTGAAGGIGGATAVRLGAAGHAVVCTDLKPPDETAREIIASGGTAVAMALDVGSADAWASVVGAAADQLGPVYALANVAGHGTGGHDTALDTTDEAWDRVMQTNLRGAWYGIRAVLPGMIEQGGGRIVNVSSAAAILGLHNTFAYAASKGGIMAMTRQVAVEYGRQGICCNAVAPGATLTPQLRKLPKEWFDRLAARNPQHRMGSPAEIAAMIGFLCSEEGGYVTGAVLPVDGGTSIYGEA